MTLLYRPDTVPRALPFWLSLALIPVVLTAAVFGGWVLLLPPLASWGLVSLLDVLVGKDGINPDAQAKGTGWHTALLYTWVPVQWGTLFGLVAIHDRLAISTTEKVALFFSVGIVTGTIGITYAHELIHRAGRLPRLLGDLALASVLYSHFRTEHLAVHHVKVATPEDPATARFGEGFWRYFLRVLPGSLRSAWRTEAARLAQRGRPVWHHRNPFWTYAGWQGLVLCLACVLGGPLGLVLFVWQAIVAIWQLELVNYVEHYGLTRQKLPSGRYESVAVHHAWNTDHRASNWLLINLQRHADHHLSPTRPFPVLQTYDPSAAPTLPAGYPVMTLLAMAPPRWRKVMNPRVRAWRKRHYPTVTDWPPAA